MLHLNRFEQHQWFIGQACDPSCVVCQGIYSDPANFNSLIRRTKPGDIINMYGATSAKDLVGMLKKAKQQQLTSRVWVTHKMEGLQGDFLGMVDDVMIWCPGAQKDSFNEACGQDYFDEFKANVRRFPVKKTLSLVVKQLNFEELPEFYDLVDECHAEGLILYYPKEFNKEERRYIKRFKKVPRMRIMPLKNAPTHTFLGLPNTIGSFRFEWHDWRHAMRGSLKKWPLIKYTL